MNISPISNSLSIVAALLLTPLFIPVVTAQTVPATASNQDDQTVLIDLTSKPDTKLVVPKSDGAKAPPTKESDDHNGADTEAGDEPRTESSEEGNSRPNPASTHKTADEGIQIHVEKSTGKSGAMNQPGAVKIYSPWPAKPITPAPAGWKFAPAPAGLKPYQTTISLGSGNTVDLSITPFVLVPLSDGLNAIRIAEPGYDPAQLYAQKNTVGTMLQTSTMELEENEKQAAEAISRLQQLLSSLPQP